MDYFHLYNMFFPSIEGIMMMSISIQSTHNLLLRLEDAHLAKANMEWGRLEGSILLLDHHHVDCTSQGRSIDLGVELLRRKRGVSLMPAITIIRLLTLTFFIMLFM